MEENYTKKFIIQFYYLEDYLFFHYAVVISLAVQLQYFLNQTISGFTELEKKHVDQEVASESLNENRKTAHIVKNFDHLFSSDRTENCTSAMRTPNCFPLVTGFSEPMQTDIGLRISSTSPTLPKNAEPIAVKETNSSLSGNSVQNYTFKKADQNFAPSASQSNPSQTVENKNSAKKKRRSLRSILRKLKAIDERIRRLSNTENSSESSSNHSLDQCETNTCEQTGINVKYLSSVASCSDSLNKANPLKQKLVDAEKIAVLTDPKQSFKIEEDAAVILNSQEQERTETPSNKDDKVQDAATVSSPNEPIMNLVNEESSIQNTKKLSHICDICNEYIEIFDDDIKLSIEKHDQCSRHQERELIFRRVSDAIIYNRQANAPRFQKVSPAQLSNVVDINILQYERNVKAIMMLPASDSECQLNQVTKKRSYQNVMEVFSETSKANDVNNNKKRRLQCSYCDISFHTKFEEHFCLFPANEPLHSCDNIGNEKKEPKHVSLYCKTCKVRFFSVPAINAHLKSESHQLSVKGNAETNFTQSSQSGLSNADTTDLMYADSTCIILPGGTYGCITCHLYFSSRENLLLHQNGRYHQNRLAEKKLMEAPYHTRERNFRYCALCKVSVLESRYELHTKENNHQNKLKEQKTKLEWMKPLVPANNSYLNAESNYILTRNNERFCLLCNVTLPTNGDYRTHVQDEKHRGEVERMNENDKFIRMMSNGCKWCLLCEAQCHTPAQLISHIRGARHCAKLNRNK